jgi:hypothetical protein
MYACAAGANLSPDQILDIYFVFLRSGAAVSPVMLVSSLLRQSCNFILTNLTLFPARTGKMAQNCRIDRQSP